MAVSPKKLEELAELSAKYKELKSSLNKIHSKWGDAIAADEIKVISSKYKDKPKAKALAEVYKAYRQLVNDLGDGKETATLLLTLQSNITDAIKTCNTKNNMLFKHTPGKVASALKLFQEEITKIAEKYHHSLPVNKPK